MIDAQPGHPSDSPEYQAASVWANVVEPGCYVTNIADQENPEAESAYWRSRDLVDAVSGSQVPTFLMAGFLEDNTKPDAVFELWNNLDGPNRAWFGPWDHVRGWPPRDARVLTSTLRSGSYTDEGGNHGTCQASDEDTGECADEATGHGLWSISQPLGDSAHVAGTPRLTVDAGAPAEANLVAAVYDIAPVRPAAAPALRARVVGPYGRASQFRSRGSGSNGSPPAHQPGGVHNSKCRWQPHALPVSPTEPIRWSVSTASCVRRRGRCARCM